MRNIRDMKRAWVARTTGAAIAAGIHVVMFALVMNGEHRQKVAMPDEVGLGATAASSGGAPEVTLFLVNLPNEVTAIRAEPTPLKSVLVNEQELLVSVLSANTLPAFEIPVEAADETDAELQKESAAVRAQMFGRYTGQIDARIERAWRKPRTALNDPREAKPPGFQDSEGLKGLFRCQVTVTQDSSGYVKEIQLGRCNGSVAWQMSLVRAIQRASPLPAPPIPSVFTNQLSLTFDADEYREGLRTEGYESERELIARLEGT